MIDAPVENGSTERNLDTVIVRYCWLITIAAMFVSLYATLELRILYADGTYYLLQILEKKGALKRVGPEIFSQTIDKMPGDAIADLMRRTFAGALDRAGIEHDFPRR